jgi:Na+/H+ antiporter NhaD/arsenite permease-like protein
MPFPILVLALVFLLIAVRRVGALHVPIWASMLFGAMATLAAGSIGLGTAWEAIDGEVMLFLFAMFLIGEALERSGLLFTLAYHLLSRAASVGTLVWRLLLSVGFASALLMNDTLAIVGTPLVLLLAREHGIRVQLLLLTLAFGVTIGSVMSPIGNPQNLLIALHGTIPSPFASFLGKLFVPTVLNLGAAYLVLRLMFRSEFHLTPLRHTRVEISDPALGRRAGAAMILLILLIFARALMAWLGCSWQIRLSEAGLIAALPILLFSPRRRTLLRHVDWQTLLFFGAMFVLMRAVWDTGVFQNLLAGPLDLAAPGTVMGISVLLSQLISNVPMVALYLPLLDVANAGESAALALAAGSTIAGNLLLLGAASNVIIVQNAEKRAGVRLGFLEFARVGVPVTLLNFAIYYLFLA